MKPTVPDRRRARRAERYAAQRVLWRVTDLQRLAYCGRALTTATAGVTVRVSGPAGQRIAGLSGVQTCGSVWACPVCSEKVNAHRQAELERGNRRWIERGGSIVLLTATMQHTRGDSLADLWDAVTPAFNRMTSGAAWVGGRRRNGDRYDGDRDRYGVKGIVRVVEVTHGRNGWHPHVHALMYLERPLLADEREELRLSMFERWARALAARGLRAMNQARDGSFVGLDLRPVTDSNGLADYFTKNGYGSTSTAGAAYEVTGSHSKKAGAGRTPFQILADLVAATGQGIENVDGLFVNRATGELLPRSFERDYALWKEWERVSHGRRQLNWSRGLRELLGLDQVEQTDEAVVEEDTLSGKPVAFITITAWKEARWYARRSELLDAAEVGGDALVELLGADWQPPPDAPPSRK